MNRNRMMIIGLCLLAGVSAGHVAHAAAPARIIRPQVPPRPAAIWFDSVSGERTTNGWGHGNPLQWQLNRDGSGWIELLNNRNNQMRRWPFRLSAAQLARVSQHLRAFRARQQDDALCTSDQPISRMRWRSGPGSGEARFDHGCSTAQDDAQLSHLTAAITIMRTAAGLPSNE